MTIRPLLTLLLLALAALSADAAIPLKAKLATLAVLEGDSSGMESVPDIEQENEEDSPPVEEDRPTLLEAVGEIVHFSKGKVGATVATLSQPLPPLDKDVVLDDLRGHEIVRRIQRLPDELFIKLEEEILPGHQDIFDQLRFQEKDDIVRLPRQVLDKFEEGLDNLPKEETMVDIQLSLEKVGQIQPVVEVKETAGAIALNKLKLPLEKVGQALHLPLEKLGQGLDKIGQALHLPLEKAGQALHLPLEKVEQGLDKIDDAPLEKVEEALHLPLAKVGQAVHLPLAKAGKAIHLPLAKVGQAVHLPLAKAAKAIHLPVEKISQGFEKLHDIPLEKVEEALHLPLQKVGQAVHLPLAKAGQAIHVPLAKVGQGLENLHDLPLEKVEEAIHLPLAKVGQAVHLPLQKVGQAVHLPLEKFEDELSLKLETLNRFGLPQAKEQIHNLPDSVLEAFQSHELPTKDDVLEAFQNVQDKLPTHADLVAEVEAKGNGFEQSFKDFTTGAVGLNSKLVAPLFNIGAKVTAPFVGFKSKLAAPFVFLGTALSKPLLKGGAKVAAPLVKLGQIKSEDFIDRNDPFFQDLKTAFKPVATATDPLHKATAPLRKAVDIGLRGFSNKGAPIDLQAEVDKVQGLEKDVELIENAGETFVQQAQQLGAAVLAKIFPSHSPATISNLMKEAVDANPDVIDDSGEEDKPVIVKDLVENVLAGAELPRLMLQKMTEKMGEGEGNNEGVPDLEIDEPAGDPRRKRHAMEHGEGRMRYTHNRMRRYAGRNRPRRRRSLVKLGLFASKNHLARRLLTASLSYKFITLFTAPHPDIIPGIVRGIVGKNDLYDLKPTSKEELEERAAELELQLRTVLALEKALVDSGVGPATALREAVRIVYDDVVAGVGEKMKDGDMMMTKSHSMGDRTTTTTAMPPTTTTTTMSPVVDVMTTTTVVPPPMMVDTSTTTTMPPMMVDADEMTTTTDIPPMMSETTTPPMMEETTTTVMPPMMNETTTVMVDEMNTTTVPPPTTTVAPDDSIVFPGEEPSRRRKRSHVEGEEDDGMDVEMEMQGGISKIISLEKIKNKIKNKIKGDQHTTPFPPNPANCMASLIEMETSECHRSETYQTRTCTAAPNCTDEIEEIDRMQALCEESQPGRHCRKTCFHFEDVRGGNCFECRTTFIRILNRAPKCREFNYCVLKGAICRKQ